MIAKKHRLKKGEIEHIQKKGQKQDFDLFIVKTLKLEDTAGICTIVSRKMAQKAIDRNRLRRRIYEAARVTSLTRLPLSIILIPKKTILNSSFEAIKEDLTTVKTKLKQ